MNNVESLIEVAILKSLAVKVLALIMASTDENLKLQVAELIDKLKTTQGKELNVKDFVGGNEASPNLRNMQEL